MNEKKDSALARHVRGIGEGLLLPATAAAPSDHQKLFLYYFTRILIDLVVLNLFVEFSPNVEIASFSISLLAAVVLQALVKVTMLIEHQVAAHFKAKPGAVAKFLRFFCAWLVLFGSKFVILWVLEIVFGDAIVFTGIWHGVVTLIVVLVVMVLAEEVVARIYRRLS